MNSNSIITISAVVLLVCGALYAGVHFYLFETDKYAEHWARTGKLISAPDDLTEKEKTQQQTENIKEKDGDEIRVSDAAPSIIAPSHSQGVWVSSAKEAIVIVNSDDAQNLATSEASDGNIQPNKTHQLTKSEQRKAEILASVQNNSQSENPLVRAVIVQMTFDEVDCNTTGFTTPAMGINFRYGSATINSNSLTHLEKVVEAYRSCPGTLHLLGSEVAYVDGGEVLMERRKQEVKYYLLQRRVPREKINLLDQN